MAAELATIERTFGKTKIRQREGDGYLDATAMCKANGKLWGDYYRLASTKTFLEGVSTNMGIPILALVEAKRGGKAGENSTWVHPKVAIDLAYWCNQKFRSVVVDWVLEIMSKGHVDIRPQQTAPAPSADFARLESMVLRLAQTVAGVLEHIASSPRALPGQTSTALNRRRIGVKRLAGGLMTARAEMSRTPGPRGSKVKSSYPEVSEDQPPS